MKEIMEREIIIANTKTQKKSKINSTATTLAELKAELSAASIDYSGMTFTEGISKTQLISDDTQLPSNVMYKGQPTNNLVILLTNTKKNISSGGALRSRRDAYALIKERGLEDLVKKYYNGKNFTQVSTDNLWAIIDATAPMGSTTKVEETVETNDELETSSSEVEEKKEEEPVNEGSQCEAEDDPKKDPMAPASVVFGGSVLELLFRQICIYVSLDVFTSKELGHLKGAIGKLQEDVKADESEDMKEEESEPVSTSDGRINDDDIEDMIDELM